VNSIMKDDQRIKSLLGGLYVSVPFLRVVNAGFM
jgi:hypothetical protein